MSTDADFAPGTFGCHEALHMAHVLAELVETRLCEHPAVQSNAVWAAKATAAADALQDLYQAIGRAHLPPTPDPPASDRPSIGPEDEARGGHEAPGDPGPTVPGLGKRRGGR